MSRVTQFVSQQFSMAVLLVKWTQINSSFSLVKRILSHFRLWQENTANCKCRSSLSADLLPMLGACVSARVPKFLWVCFTCHRARRTRCKWFLNSTLWPTFCKLYFPLVHSDGRHLKFSTKLSVAFRLLLMLFGILLLVGSSSSSL